MPATYDNPLKGLFGAQGEYLNFLHTSLGDSVGGNTYVDDLTAGIGDSLKGLNLRGSLNTPAEYNRLEKKKESIDAEWNTRQRLVTLSQSTLKRNQQYNNIVALVFLALLVILIFQWFLYPSGLLPAAVLDLVLVFIVAFLVIWMIYIAYDVSRRDNMDYDSINLGKYVKPNAALTLQQARENAKNGNIGASTTAAGSCQGPTCCVEGTFWATAAGQCIPNPLSGSPAASQFYSLNGDGASSQNAAFVSSCSTTVGSITNYVASAAKCLPVPTNGVYDGTGKTYKCTPGTYDPSTNTCVSDQQGASKVQQGFHTLFGPNADGSIGDTSGPVSNSGYEFESYSVYRKK